MKHPSRRLLLIEDDAALQTLLIDILEQAEYEVAVAMPYDYLYMAQEVKPNILVLGCDGDHTFDRGWEIAATLRRRDPALVMVMLSTNHTVVKEVGRTARGKHFAAGLVKPFTIDELLTAIAAGTTHEQTVEITG